MAAYEDVHPLEGGALRLKFRRDRRHGLPLESPLVFYPRYVAETVRKGRGYWKVYRRCKAILDEVLVAPDRWAYSDIAIAPPQRATSSTRWTSTMPRAAAKRLWRANGATTRSAWRRRTRRQRSRRKRALVAALHFARDDADADAANA